MNKSGVALAADSKATSRIQGVIKTHDTANKLFTLSKYHPVGIMVNGSAEIMQTPWETIIKVYRDKLKAKSFSTLEEYLEDFCVSLIQDCGFDEKIQKLNVQFVCLELLQAVRKTAIEEIKSKEEPEAALKKAIASHAAEAMSKPDCKSLGGVSAQSLIERYGDEIDSAIGTVFNGASEDRRNELRDYLSKVILKEIFSEGCSEVIVAGYGDGEIFPSAKAFRVDGVIADKLKCAISYEQKITTGPGSCSSAIYPFAQREMVDRFMLGVDPIFSRYMEYGFKSIAEEITEGLVQTLVSDGAEKPRILEQVKVQTNKLLEGFSSKVSEYQYEAFTKPILHMTELLPKEELANFADSLVNLTSFKRRMSLDPESVGGPIDVAVISKGDGFIWIKRKHYFNIELNRSFMDNYFRNHVTGNGETASERREKTAEKSTRLKAS